MSVSTQKRSYRATKPGNAVIGGLFGVAGIATLTAMDAVAKGLGASLPTSEVVLVRYVGAALWLALFLVVTQGAWPKRHNLRRHALRGGLMALTAWLFFYAITHLPLAIATALAMSAPIYVSLMGVVFLKESASATLVFAIALGIAGSMVIIFAGEPIDLSGGAQYLAWGAAVLAPITYAGGLVLLKHHAADEGGAAMTLAQSVFAALIVLPLAAPNFVVPPPAAWGPVVLLGLLGGVGYLLLISGIRRIPASAFSLVDYTALLWAAGFGFFFFSEVVEPSLWIGGAMIIAACAVGMRSTRGSPVEN